MESGDVPQGKTEQEGQLPIVEAFHIGGHENAVICPICGNQEHAPKVGEPGGIKTCETIKRFSKTKPRKYIVTKRAA